MLLRFLFTAAGFEVLLRVLAQKTGFKGDNPVPLCENKIFCFIRTGFSRVIVTVPRELCQWLPVNARLDVRA